MADEGSFGTGRGFGTKLNSLGNHQSCLMPGMKLAQHHSGQLGKNNNNNDDLVSGVGEVWEGRR